MRSYLLVAATFVALAASHLTLAQSPASGAASSPTPALAQPRVQESGELQIAKEQVRQLQTQIQVMKEYHNSLLDTVYWALGGVFLVVSIILGFGWFANFKVYERDKQAMRDDLDALFKAQSQETTAKATALSAALTDTVAQRLDQATTTLQGQLAGEIAKAIDPINASILSVGERVFRLQLERLKDKMTANPSDNMALTDALNLLELCRSRAQDELPETINFMLKKIEKGGKLTAREITRVNAVLDLLPTHFKALSDRLREKLVASDIF